MKQFRWAIVGTGDVAAKFVIGLRSSPGASAVVAVSRSEDRGRAFAARLGISATVTRCEDAAAMDIDVAYIASPPSEHRAHALAFIAAGKAVLIEKPFADTLADGEAIIAAARAAGVFCMEGMWTAFLPALAQARALLADGAVGAPRSLFASFANMNRVEPSNSFFRADLGGGALAHRGVYPIALAVDLLGPARLVSAVVKRGETGVDEEVNALLRHENGAMSSLYAGARTTADNGLTVLGTGGSLRLDGPIYRPFGVEVRTMTPSGRSEQMTGRLAIIKESPIAQGARLRLDGLIRKLKRPRYRLTPYIGNGYAHEAIAVMDCLRRGATEHPLMDLDRSRAVMSLMEDIRLRAVVEN